MTGRKRARAFFLYYRDIVPFHDVRLMQRCRQNLCGMMWLIYLLSISFFLYFTLFHFTLYPPFLFLSFAFFLFNKHLIPCSAAFNCNGTQCTRWQSFSKRWHWLLLFSFSVFYRNTFYSYLSVFLCKRLSRFGQC